MRVGCVVHTAAQPAAPPRARPRPHPPTQASNGAASSVDKFTAEASALFCKKEYAKAHEAYSAAVAALPASADGATRADLTLKKSFCLMAQKRCAGGA